MNEVNLKVEVHCLQPGWVSYEKNKYRLYVNNEMLTERSWIWNTNTIINEDIWVNLSPNIVNTIRIDPILDPINSIVKFSLENLKVNDMLIPKLEHEQLELSFKL